MQTDQVSAKIFEFTPRRRSVAPVREVNARTIDAPVVDWESGWYHDAAIAEEAAERRSSAEAAEKVRPLFPH